jgi:hypothetical protein
VGHALSRVIGWVERFRYGNPAQRITLLCPFPIRFISEIFLLADLDRDHFCSEYNASKLKFDYWNE